MPSMLFTLDTGAASLSRTRNFDTAQMTRLRDAIIAELQEQGISSPTNAQIMDYLVARWVSDIKTFVQNRENAAALTAAAKPSLSI
jgi:hypothetical protein